MVWTTVWSHAHRGFYPRGTFSGTVSLRFRHFPQLTKIRFVFSNEYGLEPLTIRELKCQDRLVVSEFQVFPEELYRTNSLLLGDQGLNWDLNFLAERAVSGYGFADSDLVGRTEKRGTMNFCPGLLAIEADLEASQCIVALGDSLTEGATWVAPLQQKLRSENIFLVNQGINGSQLLKDGSDHKTQDRQALFYGFDGLKRLQHCFASHQGVNKIIFSLGINDLLSGSVSLKELQEHMEKVAALCRKEQVQLFVCGITPFSGNAKSSVQKLALREEFNRWLSQRFQANFWDFSAIVGAGEQLIPAFDSGDHLHFNAAGGLAIARSIDLELLKGT